MVYHHLFSATPQGFNLHNCPLPPQKINPKFSFHNNDSAILVGRDYPHPEGIEYVRRKWKEAIRNPDNYPGFVVLSPGVEVNRGETSLLEDKIEKDNERILRKAVGKGRYVSYCLHPRLFINIDSFSKQ